MRNKEIYLAIKNMSKIGIVTLALLSCMLAYLAYLYSQDKFIVNNNLLDLFPETMLSEQDQALQQMMIQRLDKQVIVVVSSKHKDHAVAAKKAYELLQNSACFEQVYGKIDQNGLNKTLQFLSHYKEALIGDDLRQMLEDHDAYLSYLQSQLFSSFSGVSSNELLNDPLLLVRNVLSNSSLMGGKLSVHNDFLCAKDGDLYSYFFAAKLTSSGFDLGKGSAFVRDFELLKQELKAQFPEAQILYRGTAFYSDAAAKQAQSDINILGTLSLVMMCVLMLIAFKSVMPVILGAFSVLGAVICGSLLTLVIFGSIHLLTVLISISVIGICIDYTIYFCATAMTCSYKSFIDCRYQELSKSLFAGMSTTTIAYALVTLAPFPVLKQVAVFAISGLVMAFLIVITIYPMIKPLFKQRDFVAISLVENYSRLFKLNVVRYLSLALAVALSLFSLPFMSFNHDVAALQTQDKSLSLMDSDISKLVGIKNPDCFLIVSAQNDDALVMEVQKANNILDDAVNSGVLASYTRLTLPTKESQLQNFALVKSIMPSVLEFYKSLGALDINDIKDQQELQSLSLAEYLNSPIGQAFEQLYFQQEDKRSLLIPLFGVSDKTILVSKLSEQDNLVLVDRKNDFNRFFEQTSGMLEKVLMLSLAVILLSSLLRNGIITGLWCFIPSAAAAAMSLAIPSLLSMELNLFAILGALLSVGISVDYAVFNSHASNARAAMAQWSVTIAMLTTAITLGILVFSSTYAVSIFGVSLLSGIVAAFLLAPLAIRQDK